MVDGVDMQRHVASCSGRVSRWCGLALAAPRCSTLSRPCLPFPNHALATFTPFSNPPFPLWLSTAAASCLPPVQVLQAQPLLPPARLLVPLLLVAGLLVTQAAWRTGQCS